MRKITANKPENGNITESTVSFPCLLDPVCAVDSIVTKALEASARKMGLNGPEACLDCLKKNESAAFNYYSYNVAKELGVVLGSWSKNIKAAYAYSYDETDDGEGFCEESAFFPLVYMIILVEKKSKALDALMDAIDCALVQQHREMLGRDQLEHALDVRVIDDEDVKNRTGYAALLKSVYRPPIRL